MAMIEKEIKVLNIDKEKLEASFQKMGAKKVLEDTTIIWWFDSSDTLEDYRTPTDPSEVQGVINRAIKERMKQDASFRDSDVYFRVRKQGENGDITLKYNQGTSQNNILSNKEHSCDFSAESFLAICNDVEKAGFSCVAKHEKRRTSFILETPSGRFIHLDIDEWPGIPPYLEIEAGSEEEIMDMVDKLNLRDNMTTASFGKQFFAMYGVEFFSTLTFQKEANHA